MVFHEHAGPVRTGSFVRRNEPLVVVCLLALEPEMGNAGSVPRELPVYLIF